MDKLLETLISKAKLECEEAHRQLLFAFNGLLSSLCLLFLVKYITSTCCFYKQYLSFLCVQHRLFKCYLFVIGLAGIHLLKEEVC